MSGTRQSVPYWHVDAFADAPFKGNQAAVLVLEDWLPDDVLIAIAAENLFAETAFLVRAKSEDAGWDLRWFTPKAEVALCGHATLASGHVLLSGIADGEIDKVRFLTRKSGILEVNRTNEGYEVGLPAIRTAPGARDEVVKLLGAEPKEIWLSPDRYGIYLFESEGAIRTLAPNFRGLGALGDDQFICTAPGDKTDIVSRVFVPGVGVDEDSVTGSAHAALTPFWVDRLGRDSFTAHQASERSGNLTCRLDRSGAVERVWLGGACTTVVKGEFYLSG